jgi:signal transduction histidine kinase/ActR/RegA family two-component response regulator
MAAGPEAQEGLALFRKAGSFGGQAGCLLVIGLTLAEEGRFDDALECYSESQRLFSEVGDQQGRARAINASGTTFRRMGDAARAIEAYGASMAIAQSNGDSAGEARALTNIGYVYLYEKKYERAIEFARRALAIDRRNENLPGELSNCCNLIQALVASGRPQEAVDFIAGYDLVKLSGSGLFTFLELSESVSKALMLVGRFADAEGLLSMGIERARRDVNARELGSLLCTYAQLCRTVPSPGAEARQARLDAARSALNEALASASARDLDYLQGIHEEFSALCREEGRWDEAFAHVEEAHRISTRLSSASAEERLARQRSEQEAATQKARADAEARRREIERRVLQSQRTESLGVLAGGMVHHFNNLLTSILGNAQLAAMNPDLVTDALAEIEVSGRRAADLCEQIMMYTGRANPHMGAVDVASLAQESTRLLRLTLVTDCEIVCEFPPEPVNAWGDRAQLQQIMLNVLTNAVEAKALAIVIKAAIVRFEEPVNVAGDTLEPGGYVELSVTDNGEGMAPDVLSRVFEPFFTTRFTGRGLGLPASIGLARAHKGTMSVESSAALGTTVRIHVPLAVSRVAEPQKPASATPASRGARTVLIAEDEETVRRVVVRFMAKLGWKTLEAADGEEAVRVYRDCSGRIDLLVIDYLMPKANGLEAALRIRTLNPNLPVIMMSGFTKEEAVERFRAEGVGHFLKKPFELEEFRRLLRSACGAGT